MAPTLRFFLIFLLMLGVSCSSDPHPSSQNSFKAWMEPNGKLKILSTIAMIDDLVKEIGGDSVDRLTLVKGDLDPHSYTIVKGDDEKFSRADLIFFNGLGLEHGPSLHYQLTNSSKAISLGGKIQETAPERIIHLHGHSDPHIWMDISLWAESIPFIVEALSRQQPENAPMFRENGEKLKAKMGEAHLQVNQLLQSIPEHKRYLVTSHDAFNYFTRAYLADKNETEMAQWQKRFAAPEGLAPDSQISSADIQFIIDHLSKYRITVIFPESNVNQDSIKKIVDAGREKGLSVTIADGCLYGDAMGKAASNADTYLKMIVHNAQTIAHYLNTQNLE